MDKEVINDHSDLQQKNSADKKINGKFQNALEALFLCSFYIDLRDYSFRVYKAQLYMKELLESCKNAIDAEKSYVNYMVADESKEEMKAFLDMTTLKQRMKEKSVLDCIYYDLYIGWSKAMFTAVDRNENGDVETVALVVAEVSQKKDISIVETQAKHTLEIGARLWNSVKRLISASDIDTSTNSIIQELMDYYDAERAYIFAFDWQQNIGINTHEVCAKGIEAMIDTLQEVPIEAFDVWIKLFSKSSIILIKDIDELAYDENRKDEYDILSAQGIKSLIASPVYFEGKLVGLLGVDNPKRNLDDTVFIKNLAFFCVNISVREKEREDLEEKNVLDSLTGVYNRKGYYKIIKQLKKDKRPIAYAQIDIDNFKTFNDTYGHGFGDEVLKQVAVQLKETVRSGDYVVRFGGDEFIVLLTNYRFGAWESIGDKLRIIHMQLNLILKKEIYVTLSMGISWSPSGLTDEMFSLADAALYRVKNSGRAGCCIFDVEHNILYEWKDEIENNTKGNILEQSNTGACRVEFPNGEVSKGRLICNETSRSIMGFDENMTPEECFKVWNERVDEYYKEDIEKMHNAMIEKGQMEWTYLYHHPIQGTIMVRSGGRCQKTKEGIIFYGYHQSLQGTRIFLREDDSQKLINAMTNIYFASYYVDLKEDKYYTFKSIEEARHLKKQDNLASLAIRDYVQTLVKPEYREKMMQFLELSTLPERLKDRAFVETEYQSEIIDKDWCRARILVVKRNKEGVVTHVQILVESIDKEKKAKLEQEKAIRNALELQLYVGELITQIKIQHIAFIDRTTGNTKIYKNGIISKDCICVKFDVLKQWGLERTYSLDKVLYEKKFNLSYIESEIQKNGRCIMSFRQKNENEEIVTIIHHYVIYKKEPTKILFVTEHMPLHSLFDNEKI